MAAQLVSLVGDVVRAQDDSLNEFNITTLFSARWEQIYSWDGGVLFQDGLSGLQVQIDPYDDILDLGPLPQGWELKWNNYIRPFFVHLETSYATRRDPRLPGIDRPVSSFDSLPDGWVQRWCHGIPYYINQTFHHASAIDPRTSTNNTLPAGWERRVQGDGQQYYVDHNTKTTTRDHPLSHTKDPRLDVQILPAGWEMRISESDDVYFVNRLTKITTWNHPRLEGITTGWKFLVPLPEGWEMRYTNRQIYFFDNRSATTSLSDPRFKLIPDTSLGDLGLGNLSIMNGENSTASPAQRTASISPSLNTPEPAPPVDSHQQIRQMDDDSDDEAEVNVFSEPDNPGWPYHPLQSLEEIRVLIIHPSSVFNAPITCSLEHRQLSSTRSFEAVSYSWGNKDNSAVITVDGRPFLARENAIAVLLRLRNARKPRVVWIDAICINQADKTEKETQIPLMTRLYATAEQVCVWLGEDSAGSPLAMKSLTSGRYFKNKNAISSMISKLQIEYGLDAPLSQLFKNLDEKVKRDAELELGEIRELLSRPWFTRIWIMQEAIVAKKLVLMCGGETVDWNAVTKRADNARKDAEDQGLFVPRKHPNAVLGDDQYVRIKEFRAKWADGKWNVSVYKLLHDFKGLDCTDPRDKVFAFLGLTSVRGPEFKPDLDLSLRKTYTRFAKAIIQATNSLDILNCVTEWRGIDPYQPPTVAYSLLDQSRYHDIHAVVSDTGRSESRNGWARLPHGWERVQEPGSKSLIGKPSFSFVDRLAETKQPFSPLKGKGPAPAVNVLDQRLCPDGWEKTWDNLGRPSVRFNPISKNEKLEAWRKKLSRLPSWVPNWALTTDIDPAPLLDWSGANPLYWAGERSSVSIQRDVGGRFIGLEGYEFDQIFHITPPWHPEQGHASVSRRGSSQLEAWEALALAQTDAHCPYGGGDARKEATWRAHVADPVGARASEFTDGLLFEYWCDRDGWTRELTSDFTIKGGIWDSSSKEVDLKDRMRNYFYDKLEAAEWGGKEDSIRATGKRFDKSYAMEEKEYPAFVSRIHRACGHRALFVTRKGYIGLAPWNAKASDYVYVLKGGKTPFLLRDTGISRFQFIGEAYVYGIMGGEALSMGLDVKFVTLS